ncbi:MAG: 3,4-dihydroxy-2-butanone-4-phosphate synthase [Planctomycetota bacterium]
MSRFTTVSRAIDELRRGRLLIVVDAEDRENEGDLVGAARNIDPATVNFILTEARGLLCAPASPEIIERLELPMMVAQNTSLHHTAFTVSVDAAGVTTTGISASDRAATLRVLADPLTRPDGLLRPGHVFPLRAHPGGPSARPGHTEAVVELVRRAELGEVGVLAEILNADGSMSRVPELERLAERFDLQILAISDLTESSG